MWSTFFVVLLFAPSTDSLAIRVNAEVMRIATRSELWPNFHPAEIPLAIYTGDRTYLFRHPAPPTPFTTTDGIASMPGRHPAVTSNSTAEIGGVVSAALLADGERGQQPIRDLAAVAVHEAFHVFQRNAHPSWQGNEGDLFTYPVERADLLALRRSETEYLRRALGATAADQRCLTGQAIAVRRERFALMDPVHSRYEQQSELNEGLATYVQLRTAGQGSVTVPADGFAATAVRQRFYATGPALAFLLDAIGPDWQRRLEAHDSLTLDGLLSDHLPNVPSDQCVLRAPEGNAIADRASQDAAGVLAERRVGRTRFEALTGWRVILETLREAPLWPQGFDPLNAQQVDGGTLHSRMLRLGNDSLSLSMLDSDGADLTGLTAAAGEHPLFNGVRRVEVAGLERPTITRAGGATRLSAPGFEATFHATAVTIAGTTVLAQALPGTILGDFTDDYQGRFTVTPSQWFQHPRNTYEIVAWHPDEQFLIARNAPDNPTAPGLWTRIDWVMLPDLAPFTWGFCFSAYDAPTRAAAEATQVVDRAHPKTGCNGNPFTRMRPEK